MAGEPWPLPEGWVWTTLGDSCDVILGQSPPSETYNTDGIGLPFYQGKAEFGDLYPTVVKWCSQPGKLAEAGDVLVSIRAPVGPTNLCRERSCIGRGLAALRPPAGMPSLYLLYLLRHLEQDVAGKATGTTFPAIGGDVLRRQPIPLAPLPEQHRIVAVIEELFSDLDAGVAALKRVQANLKRYRASVLKAACEGQLVPTEAELAREEGRAYEPADILLKRILAERRVRWEAEHPGKKYVEPTAPDTAGLPELPKGWCWATVYQLSADEPNSITDGPFGSNLKTEHYTSAGPRVIRLQNIGDGEFRDEQAHISQQHFDSLRRHQVFANDLVIAGLGETLPRACIIPGLVEPAIVKADCIRFKPHPKLADFRYLNAALNSEVLKKVAARIVHGVGRPRMNQQEIKSLPIPLPPLAEQRRIAAEIDRRLSVVAELEATVAANLARAGRLRQAVLKRAFERKLMEQHPSHRLSAVLSEKRL